jgi:hypothetical protein
VCNDVTYTFVVVVVVVVVVVSFAIDMICLLLEKVEKL